MKLASSTVDALSHRTVVAFTDDVVVDEEFCVDDIALCPRFIRACARAHISEDVRIVFITSGGFTDSVRGRLGGVHLCIYHAIRITFLDPIMNFESHLVYDVKQWSNFQLLMQSIVIYVPLMSGVRTSPFDSIQTVFLVYVFVQRFRPGTLHQQL